MLGSYRELLAREGARQLTFLCALSWLSYCGYALGMVLVVHAATGSFGQAGSCAAALSLGIGLLAPARGNWLESRGALAIRVLCTTQITSGLLLLLGVRWVGIGLAAPAAFALGATSPPLIAVARSRWTAVAGPALTGTALALFAAMSDAAQLGGPALVAGIAAALDPAIGLAILILGASTAGLLFSRDLQPSDAPRPGTEARSGLWHLLRHRRGLQTLLLSCIGSSFWISGLELFATSFAARHGSAELGAIPIASSSIGGIASSLIIGPRLAGHSPARRYLAGLTAGASVLVLLLLATSLAELTGVFILVGAAFGVINVALYQLIDTVAPPDRSIAAFSVVSTAAAAGGASGAAITGRLVESSPATAELLLLATATGAAAFVFLRFKTLTADRERTSPSTQDCPE